MVDVALVQPPNPVLEDPTTRFPLGLAYLEAMLVREGYRVATVDLRDKPEGISLIPEASLIGFTATTGEIGSAKRMARMVKERDPRVMTVIGGAHATYMPEDCREDFDLVVAGEAEYIMLRLVQEGHPGGVLYGGPPPSLDSLPFPVRHPFSFSETLFEGAGYGKGPKATSILSSRGCPMQCSFCQTEPRKARFRSPENVVEEIKQIQRDWDCHRFRFEDDNLTLNKTRALKLFEALVPLKIGWRAHTRSDIWDDELAEAARRAGAGEFGFGFESADENVLRLIRKRETVQQHREAVRICKRHGLRCKAFWMTSLPGETWQTIQAIKDFMAQEKPDRWIVSQLCPYPGSDIWAHPETYHLKWVDMDLGHYWNFWRSPLVEYEHTSKEELAAHYKELVFWLSKEFPRDYKQA